MTLAHLVTETEACMIHNHLIPMIGTKEFYTSCGKWMPIVIFGSSNSPQQLFVAFYYP
jgi:hypothetical protein